MLQTPELPAGWKKCSLVSIRMLLVVIETDASMKHFGFVEKILTNPAADTTPNSEPCWRKSKPMCLKEVTSLYLNV